MPDPGTPTLEQLRVFLAVVDAGSFAAAARKVNRAVSVVSYAIANLEGQLGVILFERAGTCRPRLTDAGRAVLAEARTVAEGMDGLRARVRGLLEGWEAEVHLAVDVMLPAPRLAETLRAFAAACPTVTLRLHVEALGAVAALVAEGRAVIGISGPQAVGVDGIERRHAGALAMVPVASPGHPLARMARVPPGAARDHVQLVLTDRSRATEGRDYAVVGRRTWRLADLGAKHALLREGIGWGNMPLPLVAGDLAAGTLARLDLPERPDTLYPFSAIWRRDMPPGPAGSWLLDRFVQAGADDGSEAATV